jgi:uncharacterized membrane protein
MNNIDEKQPNNKFNLREEWYILLLILATLLIGLYFYPQLPDKVPSHWNMKGQVDGWSGKAFAVWFFPLLNFGLYIMFFFLPRIDPRRENYSNFTGPYKIIRIALHVFFAVIYLVSLTVALGFAVKVDFFVKISVALLFILLGNYMGKFQPNYFVGIKTPWTLANEEVWRKTHRFAAPLWVALGTLDILLSFFQTTWAAVLLFSSFMIMAFVPMLYSYLIFQKINKK